MTQHTNTNGFTLVELIVAASLFVIAVGLAVGLFVSATGAQRKVVAVQNVDDNTRFLMDFMSREIRMSRLDPGQEGMGRTQLTMTRTTDGEAVTYRFDGTNNNLVRQFEGEELAVNADTVDVSGFFDIRGADLGDDEQPVVTIVFTVEQSSGQPGEGATAYVQTSIAQRGFNPSD